jgi:hypothetical protein
MQTLFPLTIASSRTFPVTPFSAVTGVSPPLFVTSTGAARISSSREAPPSASRRTPFKPPATAHPFLRLPFLSCSHMPGGKTLMHQYQELITESLTLGLKATTSAQEREEENSGDGQRAQEASRNCKENTQVNRSCKENPTTCLEFCSLILASSSASSNRSDTTSSASSTSPCTD